MKHLINWLEIPCSDFDRAVRFYSTILGIEISRAEIMGSTMGFFPSDGTNVSGALVAGENYAPSDKGVLAYLNGGNDLNEVLSKVEGAGGSIVLPKTQISPEHGNFALFIDSEGGLMALHSPN